MNLDRAENRIQSDRDQVNSRYPLFDLPVEKTRAEQIFARFKIFHAAHDEVWRLFCVLTHEELARDRQPRADAIIHEIRSRLKISINNDFAAYYSRLFSVAYPALANVFKKRKRTSAGRAAQKIDLEITDNGAPENEDALIDALTELAFQNSPGFGETMRMRTSPCGDRSAVSLILLWRNFSNRYIRAISESLMIKLATLKIEFG